MLDGTLPDARVLPALRLVAQAGSQQLGATLPTTSISI